MQIMINIPERIYHDIMDDMMPTPLQLEAIVTQIYQGTPLPKGHGRLIDASQIEFTHTMARSCNDGHIWTELCATQDEISDMPTIIEAERGKDADSN